MLEATDLNVFSPIHKVEIMVAPSSYKGKAIALYFI